LAGDGLGVRVEIAFLMRLATLFADDRSARARCARSRSNRLADRLLALLLWDKIAAVRFAPESRSRRPSESPSFLVASGRAVQSTLTVLRCLEQSAPSSDCPIDPVDSVDSPNS
jgi:hypothetical protein